MATTIKLKNGSGAPLAADLVQGEVALDLTNKRIYSENASGTVIEMGTSPSTIDINAGTIDGTVIGGASAAAGTFTTLNATGGGALTGTWSNLGTVTTVDINGGTIDGVTIGGASAGAITGTTITGTSFVSSGNMTFGDNDKAIFGAGSDLEIYHDGSHSYISDQGTGNLRILATEFQVKNATNTANILNATDGGGVNVYYNNSVKLATTATGIDVTGTVTADGLTVQSGIADIRAGNIGPSANASVNIGRDDTSISGGNPLGYVQFLGSDNTAGSLTPHAYIGAIASGTHTAGSNPTELVFGTTAGASETILDRLKIADNGDISFYEDTGTTPKLFWDASAESLGIGTTSPSAGLHVLADINPVMKLDRGSANTTNANLYYNGTLTGQLSAASSDFQISAAGASTPISFYTGGTEAMRIDSSGNLFLNKTTLDDAVAGVTLQSAGTVRCSRADSLAVFNRLTTDGTLVELLQAGVAEGSISVSGTTVSYNGGHLSRWSQTADNTRIDLLKGTVMTNLDQMAVWGDEDNEQLNCMAVSSVEGDPNVAGVFVNWDNDDEAYTADMNIAMTGDMIIRIAQGTTVQRGDLLMSAGDGTAKPQGDDIVRSKTIAKVTSTHVSHTYADGSYCVPCVLMAC